jgi:hypothetical protein
MVFLKKRFIITKLLCLPGMNLANCITKDLSFSSLIPFSVKHVQCTAKVELSKLFHFQTILIYFLCSNFPIKDPPTMAT